MRINRISTLNTTENESHHLKKKQGAISGLSNLIFFFLCSVMLYFSQKVHKRHHSTSLSFAYFILYVVFLLQFNCSLVSSKKVDRNGNIEAFHSFIFYVC